MKAPEVDGAGVSGVFEEGEPGPDTRGPQAPFLGVIGFSECGIDVFREDMEPSVEVPLCAGRQPALDIIATPFDPAVDLLDLSAEVAKQGQRFRLQERNRHGDHGQGQNTAGVLDGLVRVRDYGVDGSSHVVSPEKGESPGH